MEKWILVLLLQLFQAWAIVQGNDFIFKYYEKENGTDPTEKPETPAITKYVTLTGSYGNLGDWPHWCLGNMAQCSNGLGIHIRIKFTETGEESSDLIVFSNGGHSRYSNGAYLLQRFGNEYEFGVAMGPSVWSVVFRLVPEFVINLHAVWDQSNGLDVSVDGASHVTNQPRERDFEPWMFETFTDVVLGVHSDNSPHIEEQRFEIEEMSLFNWPIPPSGNDGGTIDPENSWLGCGPFTFDDAILISNEEAAVSECQSICSAYEEAPIPAIQDSKFCACVNASFVSNTFSDKGMCTSSMYWHLYAVAVMPSPEADYTVTVTVEKLGNKEYVKPLEAVLVKIETDFDVQVPFTIDFGDGTITEVIDTEVSYYWVSEGTYQIMVETAVGIVTVSGSTSFTVEDVDEGYAGDYIIIDTFHDEESQVGHVDVTSIDYAKSNCRLGLGDRDKEFFFEDLANYVEFRSVKQNFTNFGQYYFGLKCYNPYGVMYNDTEFISQNFETAFHFQEVGTVFQTEMVGNAQFFYDLEVDHNDENVTVNHRVSGDIVTVAPEFLRIQENFLTYKLEDLTIDKRILYVQNKIGQPEIHSRQIDGAWNLTTNITIKVPPGNNMYLNVSFSEGEDQIFYIHYLQNASEIVFEIMFPVLGYYPVTANISNDISFNSSEALVSVEVPIRTISVVAADITDKASPLKLEVHLNEGMQGPAKASFRVDYDNGVVETYYFYSETFFFTTFKHEYFYPDWGNYYICVTAFNQISSVRRCIMVQVGERITYIDITMPSAGRFKINETTTSIVRCPRGSDKTYIVNFGDGEYFVFTDRYLKDTENFEDETTTSATTTSDATKKPKANENKTMNASYNDTMEYSQNYTDASSANALLSTTTPAFAMNVTSTTESTLKRRRRAANDTGMGASGSESVTVSDDTMESDGTTVEESGTSQQTTESSENTTSSASNSTDATIESSLANATSAFNETFTNETMVNATEETTTTKAPVTTTTIMTTTTTEPIPGNATDPVSSNTSAAKRLRDGTIRLTHEYRREGTFTVKVKVINTFNWAQDILCPPVIVREEDSTKGCESPVIAPPTKLLSNLNTPLQFFRSDQINLTAAVNLRGCNGSTVQYSWRTLKIVEEDGRWIQRPHHGDGLCLQQDSEKIFRYPRSSLPFGLYRVILTVCPTDHPLKETTTNFYMKVNPSAPYAIIDGNEEHQWFLIYATTMIKFQNSVDPDFNTTDGIEYDLVCMKESDKIEAVKMTHDDLISQSSLLLEGITHKYTSKNKVRLYEHSECFEKSSNLTKDLRFPKGEFNVPSEYFVSDATSFAMGLYVTKNNFTTSAYATFEIRLSNSSNLLDQLDDLLKSKDTTGVMRAVEALSELLVTDTGNKTEEEDFEAQEEMTELKSKLIGALDSVSAGVKDIGQCGGMLDLVGGLTKDASSTSDNARASATSAIKNTAGVTEEFGDEPLDTLAGVGQKVVGGVSNVLPKKDTEMEELLKQHEKSKKLAEKDAAAVLAPTEGTEETDGVTPEEDIPDLILEEAEEDPALTGEVTEEELQSKTPLPYNKLLRRFDVLHSNPVERMYKYLMFYEPIFRHVIKNKSEEIMINPDILKMTRNDIFGYISVTEEPGDVDWYFNRFFDQEKHRRDMIRKNADRDVSGSFLGAIDSMSSVLLNKTVGNQTVSLDAPGLNVAMKKASNETDDESDEDVMESEGGGVQLPKSVLGEAGGNGSEIGQTMIVNKESPFTFANENDTTEVGTSVLTLKFSTPGTKDEVKVSNSTKPMTIKMKGDASKVEAPKMWSLMVKDGEADKAINYHPVNVTKNDTSMHLILTPLDPENTFEVLLAYEDYPNDTHHIDSETIPRPEWDGNHTHKEMLRHTYFPDPSLTAQAGMYRVGVKIRNAKRDYSRDVEFYNYTWQTFLGGCRFWNDENETWSSEGCTVSNRTTYYETVCLCTHLTSFGGEMVVPPNTIDFKNVWAKFKNLSENAAVFSTVVALLGLYVIGLIWARHMDKKDIVKWGASPLDDNLPTDNYHYQLSVSTGMKKHASTASNISFIISGETCDTGVRRLFDGKRKRHERGSIMNYICSVENKLGPLSFCRIWHDNSGTGKSRSWFLDQIECTDLQTGERYFFLCNRWLACEEDDGMVDRVLPVASLDDLVAFKQLFSSSIRKKLTSDHLWLSVFSRPTRSSFTRVQRISCCMSLLFLTMITNAMWFKSDSDGDTNENKQVVSLKLGPFSFTLQQIFISLASTIIVFPPSFLLVTLFRRTKQKKNTVVQSNLRRPKRGKWKNLGNNQSHSDLWGAKPKSSRLRKFKESVSELLKGNKKSKYDACDDDEESSIPAARLAGAKTSKKDADKKKKKPFMFPPWCNYIAWILCFFSVITPAFFTILYSMEWGATKANEWLTTFLLSFFQSVIVVQPIKVLCLVAFIACVLKKPDLDEEGDCSDELNNAIAAQDEVLLTKGQDAVSEIAARRKQANDDFQPPDMEALEESRQNRMKEIRMEEILKEMLIYFFFILILFFLSYQQRDKVSFQFAENLKAMFLGKFESISTVLEYWVWLEKYFLPTLFMTKYHNGTEMVKWWDKRCINDFMSRRIGIARMRQMRIKANSCSILDEMETTIGHCRNDYNWIDDDTRAYMPGWEKTSEENETILDDLEDVNPWVYQNSFRLKNAPYVATLQTYKGGGYVVNFERSYRRTARNLTRLRQENWFDLRTRAIFLEFTVYNPNSNLYASAIMVTEFPSWGAAVPRSEFKVFRLQSYVGGFGIVVIFFEVLYCCFTLYFFVRCIRKVKKERCAYFKNFWDALEFVLLCFGVACIAMYAFKHILTEVAMRSLKKQSKAEFINFQSLALYDEFYGYMTAIVVFLASIQFLKLLQFNKKMNMLGDTVRVATKDLKVFSIAFLLYFFAFVIAGFLLFGQQLASYNGIIQSMESNFAFALGSFDFEAMSGAQKFLGPIFFFLYIGVVYVGLMSIFITIIADAYVTVQEDIAGRSNDYEMVDFIWRKFKAIIGVK